MEIDLFTTYPFISVALLVILSVCVVVILLKIVQKIGLEKTRAIVYKAFVTAENTFTNNDERFEYVVEVTKEVAPTFLKPFITDKVVRKTVQLWFDMCKDLLDDGKLNHSKRSQDTITDLDNIGSYR